MKTFMKVCENCKLIFQDNQAKCTKCNGKCSVPLKTDTPTTEEALAWLLETRCIQREF